MWEVRRSRPPLGRVARRNDPPPLPLMWGGQFSASQSESAAVLDTGAPANLVCYKWLGNHNSFLERRGLEKAYGKCAIHWIFMYLGYFNVHFVRLLFPIPRMRDSSLEMEELVKSSTQQILKSHCGMQGNIYGICAGCGYGVSGLGRGL